MSEHNTAVIARFRKLWLQHRINLKAVTPEIVGAFMEKIEAASQSSGPQGPSAIRLRSELNQRTAKAITSGRRWAAAAMQYVFDVEDPETAWEYSYDLINAFSLNTLTALCNPRLSPQGFLEYDGFGSYFFFPAPLDLIREVFYGFELRPEEKERAYNVLAGFVAASVSRNSLSGKYSLGTGQSLYSELPSEVCLSLGELVNPPRLINETDQGTEIAIGPYSEPPLPILYFVCEEHTPLWRSMFQLSPEMGDEVRKATGGWELGIDTVGEVQDVTHVTYQWCKHFAPNTIRRMQREFYDRAARNGTINIEDDVPESNLIVNDPHENDPHENDPHENDPHENFVLREEANALLATCSQEERLAFYLLYRGYTVKEVARKLKKSEHATKKMLQRRRKRLKSKTNSE